MYCKKCGEEIKEGNIFCTNCGTSINENVSNNKEPLTIKLNTAIVFIILIILLSSVIVFIIVKGKNKNIMQNSTANEETNTIYDESSNSKIEETYTDNSNNNENYQDNNNLLEQIYLKYPELKDKEGIICSNYDNEYWLLDEKGKKVYFTDMESFELALKRCTNVNKLLTISETDENVNNNSNNSYVQTDENTDTNTNSDNNYEVENDSIIYLYSDELENKSKDELEKYLEEKGLKVNYITKNVEIPYPDEKVGTLEIKPIIDLDKNVFKNGEYVNINAIKYVAKPLNIEMYFLPSYYAKYEGKKVCILGTRGNYTSPTYPEYFSYYDIDKAKEQYEPICEFKLYINDVEYYIKHSFSGYTATTIKHTFNDEEKVTFKIVAPYLCPKDSFEVVGTDVVLFEDTISIKELYSQTSTNSTDDHLDWDLRHIFDY